MKSLTDLINESNNEHYNFNIKVVDSGKLKDTQLINSIIQQIKDCKDTYLDIDTGYAGLLEISFTKFNTAAKTCLLTYKFGKMEQMLNLPDYNEENLPINDAINKGLNIAKSIKSKI